MESSLVEKIHQGYVLLLKLHEWYSIAIFRLKRRKKYIKNKALSNYPKQTGFLKKHEIDEYIKNMRISRDNFNIQNELRQRESSINIEHQQLEINSTLSMKMHTEPEIDFMRGLDHFPKQITEGKLVNEPMLSSQILSSLGLMNVKSQASYKSSPPDFDDGE